MTIAAASGESRLDVAETALAVVFVVAALAAVAALIKITRKNSPAGTEPWRASWLDFGIWLWLVLCAGLLAQKLFILGHPNWPSQATQTEIMIGAYLFPLAMMVAQLAILGMKKSWSPLPVNRSPLPLGKALGIALLTLLAAFPLIDLFSLVWQTWLEKMHVALPLQPPVKVLEESTNSLQITLTAIFAVLIAPVNEELFFRAGIYRFCKSRLPRAVAAILASLVFALSHANLPIMPELFFLGLALSWVYERTGHIAAPMLVHALFNLINTSLILLSAHASIVLKPNS